MLGVLLLAGCGAPAAVPPAPDVPAMGVAPSGQSSDRSAATWHQLGVPARHEVALLEGSFGPAETCMTGQCLLAGFAGGSHTRRMELESLAAPGVPTLLRAVLERQSPDGSLELRLDATANVHWVAHGYGGDGSRTETLDALVTVDAGSSLALVVLAHQPAAGDMPFLLQARLDSDPGWLPPGLPVAVQAAPGARLRGEPVADGADVGDLVLFGPGDQALGRAPALAGVQAAAAGGEHVL
ncbi:MAG TPA: hypothetical protein VFH47_00695, partial [Candidatus Thermoplasmatota archaeon]|nr:hypothetical protein [Candidatus Thermoplasmatota archaeon]